MLQKLRAGQASLYEEQTRAWQRLWSAPDALRAALRTRVGATPHDVVFRSGKLSLLRYRRSSPATRSTPLLLCYALVNRPYILDLQPERSVVQRYLERGFEVYLIDWGIPSLDDRHLGLEHYVRVLLDSAVNFVLREQRAQRLHLAGYCMGGTLAALYTALEPRHIETLTLLAAPIDFSGREALLHVWTDPRYFDVDALLEANGNCPAAFLQLCFLAMKPIQNLVEKNITFLEQLDDERFVTQHFAMERWVNDNIPVAGATFRDFVKKLYQQNQLVQGQLCLGEQRIDLGKIDCPLLLLTAQRDHLVMPASTRGIRGCVRSSEITELNIDAGHVGLVVSSKSHRTLWPEATRWLADHSPSRTQGAAHPALSLPD